MRHFQNSLLGTSQTHDTGQVAKDIHVSELAAETEFIRRNKLRQMTIIFPKDPESDSPYPEA